jgi:sister chromatid cohesion protein DCC1
LLTTFRLYLKSAALSSATAPAHAILCTPDTTYRIQQKNSSNPIMILEPYISTGTESDNTASNMPCNGIRTIATIEDTLELYRQESETAPPAPAKVNKWHEKFAKGRGAAKEKD